MHGSCREKKELKEGSSQIENYVSSKDEQEGKGTIMAPGLLSAKAQRA